MSFVCISLWNVVLNVATRMHFVLMNTLKKSVSVLERLQTKRLPTRLLYHNEYSVDANALFGSFKTSIKPIE